MQEGPTRSKTKYDSEEKGLYRVQLNPETIISATISGRISFHADVRSDFPAVGDWVLVETPLNSQRGVIRSIIERKNVIQRRGVGGSGEVVPDVKTAKTRNRQNVYATIF